MSVITIRERQKTETGFEAIVSFDRGAEYVVAIADPFTIEDEERLEWYFEEWLTFPFGNTVKAERAVESIQSYGESLFKQVFRTDFKAYSEYSQLRGSLSKLQIEIVGNTPAFQALHWEALRDAETKKTLATECVVIRKSIKPVAIPAEVELSAVINLLLVTARPNEAKDIGYRTTSRPLIEVLENSSLRVNVHLLRPGTYEALERHLQEKKAGFYHIIHFDGHGSLATFQQLQKAASNNRSLFKSRYGRSDLQPYDGMKAFLYLETETAGKSDPVEAQELANLLTGMRIPVCILDACQSGKQLGEECHSETSLGSQLMAAGMQVVVGMSYSITVSAAAILMEQFYKQLFANKTLTQALQMGRREMFNRKDRKAYSNQFIQLEDWLLPVVYCDRPVNFNLREFTPEEEEEYFATRGSQYRFEQPTYGFVGRDVEILIIEKSLLRHNMLLLRGMGGTGKTTLLTYLRQWWQTTHFAEKVFYFGYDQKAWTLAQILFEIGNQVYNRFESSQFQTMNQAAQVEKMVDKLRSASYILILDNLESVTGAALAIQNTLPEAERYQIRDFLGRLVGGGSRVVLGSRCAEEWLQPKTFKTNIYQLPGLDKEARSELAEKILQRHVNQKRIDAIRQDAEFKRLMKLLAGYPLAMEVVLANLQRQSPAEILARLQAADVDLDTPSEDKTKSILKCVEYSHSNLSPAAQNLLLCLAPFSGFIWRNPIPLYAEQLQKLEPFKDYAFDEFDAAIQEAINWGLLSPLDSSPSPASGSRGEQDERLLTIQPVFPYFLQTKLDALDDATRTALRTGFKNHYQGLADDYKQLMDSKDAQERQIGEFFCKLEYENLYTALQISLERQESVSIFFCLERYFRLISDPQNNLKLAESVYQSLEKYPPAFLESELGYQVTMTLDRLACCYLETNQYQLAKQSYQKTLEIIPALNIQDERQRQLWIATTYHQLGIVAEELREFEEARRNYQLALALKVEFSDRYSQADTYGQLGNVAQQLREFEEARRNYQFALSLFVEFGDRYSQACTYHHLGIVAEELREFEEARRNYQFALSLFVEFGDRYYQASTYGQLGNVAEKLREFEEARRNYQLAFYLYVEFSDRHSQARTYHQLGKVAQELREFEEARRNYQLALSIYVEFSDRYYQAGIYYQLGLLAKAQEDYAEARINLQTALQIFTEVNDEYWAAIAREALERISNNAKD